MMGLEDAVLADRVGEARRRAALRRLEAEAEPAAERRAALLLSVAAMAKEQSEISDEIEALEAERILRQSDLYAYRQTLAFAF